MNGWKRFRDYFLSEALLRNEDIFERARIRMTFNVALIVICFLIVFDVILLGSGMWFSFAVSLSVQSGMAACLYSLKLLKNHALGARIAVSVILIALTADMFFSETIALVDILWFAMAVLFTFFTIGRLWGTAAAIYSAAVCLIYVKYFFYSNFHNEEIYTDEQIAALAVTVVFGFVMMYLILHEVRKAQEEAERKLKDNVASLQLLNGKLEHLNTDLAASNKNLESFTSSVSHDLRAPLRAIKSFSEILVRKHKASLNEEGNEVLHAIKESAGKMDMLITDLLSFSRSGSKDLAITAVNMNDLVTDVLEEYKLNEGSVKAELKVNELPSANVDAALLKQVWYNLISNAIKYSSVNAHPVIDIGGKAAEHEIVYFVKDNGVGFDEKYSDKLFVIFQRLHSEVEFKGTGVGLAIVKQIVNRHGGRVWAESKKGEGAVFYFSIPL